MFNIQNGNLNKRVKDDQSTGGWVIGHFLSDNDFFKSDDFEVKWAVHTKGEIKDGVIAASVAKTIVILINGRFKLSFPNENKEVILSKQGDFVSYDAHEVLHSGEAMEDSTVLVIRWPSKR